jgi:hypothetical protein
MNMFDINELAEILENGEEGEAALTRYQDALLKLFSESPEGLELKKNYPDFGFWSAQLIYYGFAHIGVDLTHMTVNNVEEIVLDLFPRKISLTSPESAKDAIPELVAFWTYLGREYGLDNADSILKYLMSITEDEFVEMMFDLSKFGMAKSFFMAGQAAGFDMSNPDEMNAFMHLYNQSLVKERKSEAGASMGGGAVKQKKAKNKQKRKAAKIARKKNRK